MPHKPPEPPFETRSAAEKAGGAPPVQRDRPPAAGRPGVVRTLLVYLAMLAITAVIFFVIRSLGESRLGGPATAAQAAAALAEPKASAAATKPGADVLRHVLLALAAVIALGRVLGGILRYVGQPPVIGEVLAGILLGPSLLGWLSPAAAQALLPASAAPYLGVLAQIGVIFYMFVVGLEFDAGLLAQRGHAALAISHASILAPFLCGVLLALAIYERLAPPGVTFTAFALFLGVAMSITAFPVLARILTDRGMNRTPLGMLALCCAAVDDVTAWCLLAMVVGVATAHAGSVLVVIALTIGYALVMLLVVRPLLVRYGRRLLASEGEPLGMTIIFVALLLSAAATEWIGIHAIFGGFLLGVIIPHESGLARGLGDRLSAVVAALLLPAFFAFTGMRTEIWLLSDFWLWLWCGLIIVVATVGKLGGTMIAARLTGLGMRESAGLGVLMNTRGLMELVVLNIGLDLGVISPTLFTMMVVMAIVTTVATSPALNLVLGAGSLETAA
jgi:Kef-type K+ transport system membrane component KefB